MQVWWAICDGNTVPSIGLNLSLMGAVIIPDGKVGGALKVRPDIDGYATGNLHGPRTPLLHVISCLFGN